MCSKVAVQNEGIHIYVLHVCVCVYMFGASGARMCDARTRDQRVFVAATFVKSVDNLCENVTAKLSLIAMQLSPKCASHYRTQCLSRAIVCQMTAPEKSAAERGAV